MWAAHQHISGRRRDAKMEKKYGTKTNFQTSMLVSRQLTDIKANFQT